MVTAFARRPAVALKGRLLEAMTSPGAKLARVRLPGGRTLAVLRVALGPPREVTGALVLAGRTDRLTERTLPAGFPRELGAAIHRVWQLHRRALRTSALNDITRLGAGGEPLDVVLAGFADGVARLVTFDAIAVGLVDAERSEVAVLDLLARSLHLGARRDERMALDGTLVARVVAGGASVRVDDLAAAGPDGRALLGRGYRSAALVPLASGGAVFGAVILATRAPAGFDDGDVDAAGELARPLASAIEQRRLLDESRRRAEELAALYATSQAITARLDTGSVLDRISRSVTALIGSSGCGIGLLEQGGARLRHVAAHGMRTEEWRTLSIPPGEGIIGACAASGEAVRVDDVRRDPRSARRDIDEREGIRSMLCVPLRVGGSLIGVISAFSTRPAALGAHHQRILEAFAEQAGIAIHNAQLFEASVRRARETRALLEAGRAVSASLDVNATIRVILEEARSVLGVDSCGLATLDPVTRELVSVASLDLPAETVSQIRVKEGEGIAGLAVAERRPVQSADLAEDARVRYRELSGGGGFRSMLAAPLRVGQRAIGAVTVLRRDVHRFSPDEEELLLALADQAAIALEHARLYAQQEAMVAERTRELDAQKRFVEVILETLPLGVFVLDAGLAVARVNRDGARLLPAATGPGPFTALLPAEQGAPVERFLRSAFATRRIASLETETAVGGEAKTFRLTAAPFEPAGDAVTHLALLVEDVTLAKRLERQVLLTERLTTAGRLAAGVAHELNNPLATIAGCAEALLGRAREQPLASRPEIEDFRHYLGLIEEEAYRCKEITGSLLQFVREPGSRRAPTDLNALVQKTVELLAHQARFVEGRFETELDPSLPRVTVNEGQMRQVFLGVAANALDAMGRKGTLTIRSRPHRGEVEVEFEDEGPGIPDDVLPRIFDPFFTTKPPGQGTGLGLAIAQGIVTDHGGRIEVTSRVGKGSVFRVVLPQ
ncbi:MAG: GAF domain-containing protein [Candidatus Rokubacteria bacterium]|nr:GAF domain-containing protein [Candidatus Rokubacteria bacterium]MBI3826148.1 GAF domain-containing protein [Candidatus Rokubacteria bacterium]